MSSNSLAQTPAASPSTPSPAAVYLAHLAEGSRRGMGQALRVIAEIVAGPGADPLSIPWHELRYEHTQAVRARLCERYSAPNTINTALSALRGTLREALRLGLMPVEAWQRATDLPSVRGARVLRGRALSAGEVRALFGACDPAKAAGLRDAALLAVLYGAGLRRAEAAGLALADHDPQAATLRVLGKGNKERLVPLPAGSSAHLARWLAARGQERGALLLAVHRSGSVQRHGLTPPAILAILQRLARAAGVAALSPHDCRRSYASDLLDAGADLAVVQGLLGHASPTTTARYDRRGERARRRAADLLHVPAPA